MLLNISDGNTKLGKIPNVSLVPVRDCLNCSECKKDCYALKAFRAYPNVKKNWMQNSKAFRSENYGFLFGVVSDYLEKKNPRFFRIHVAGDFINQGAVDFWAMIADHFPKTKFLAFTKSFQLDYSDLPNNLQIIFSMWTGLDDTAPQGFPRAWMDDGIEDRIPADAIECTGFCETCGMCWNLSKIKRDVFFPIH